VTASAADIEAARALVAGALAVSVDRIRPETKMYDNPIWDSLGQLSIILAVEETLHTQITDESVFDTLTSVRGIAEHLSSGDR
jgi:acyl carrier protein